MNGTGILPAKAFFAVARLRHVQVEAGYHTIERQAWRCCYRLTSAAEAGRGGIEIWFLREKDGAWHTGFRKELIQALYADAQVLTAKATCKGIEYLFFIFHAPHGGAQDEVHQKFWTNFQKELVYWVKRFPNFVGGFDANADMSFESEPHIGAHGLEARTNVAGTYLQTLLPSTYECCHSGSTSTWLSNANGQGARCDYIMLPCTWSGQCSTEPDDELDSGTNGIDHMPLRCTVTVHLPRGKRMKQRSTFDRKALQQCPREQLANIFQPCPKIPWNADVHQHATELAQWIGEKLHQHFPPAGPRPRKS